MRLESLKSREFSSWHPGGFTLVEILIVISIIAILASLSLAGLTVMQKKSREAAANVEINTIANAIERYYSEEGKYPALGKKIDEDTNHFPYVINALIGEKAPNGPGGRSSPYCELELSRIVVVDEDVDDEDGPSYREAKPSERRNPKIRKYFLDHFSKPYIYRCNRGQQKIKHWMRKEKSFDLYSTGADGIDQTALGEDYEGESDDIGNW